MMPLLGWERGEQEQLSKDVERGINDPTKWEYFLKENISKQV